MLPVTSSHVPWLHLGIGLSNIGGGPCRDCKDRRGWPTSRSSRDDPFVHAACADRRFRFSFLVLMVGVQVFHGSRIHWASGPILHAGCKRGGAIGGTLKLAISGHVPHGHQRSGTGVRLRRGDQTSLPYPRGRMSESARVVAIVANRIDGFVDVTSACRSWRRRASRVWMGSTTFHQRAAFIKDRTTVFAD